jgi:hypothetical protein
LHRLLLVFTFSHIKFEKESKLSAVEKKLRLSRADTAVADGVVLGHVHRIPIESDKSEILFVADFSAKYRSMSFENQWSFVVQIHNIQRLLTMLSVVF